MTLQEAEERLSEIDEKINVLLKERETVLKEWDTAFHTKDPQNIVCIDENTVGVHNFYLVSGESKKHVCLFSERDIIGSIEEFYKCIDNSMRILNIANGSDFEIPDYQRNLVYAKAMEIREKIGGKSLGSVIRFPEVTNKP